MFITTLSDLHLTVQRQQSRPIACKFNRGNPSCQTFTKTVSENTFQSNDTTNARSRRLTHGVDIGTFVQPRDSFSGESIIELGSGLEKFLEFRSLCEPVGSSLVILIELSIFGINLRRETFTDYK